MQGEIPKIMNQVANLHEPVMLHRCLELLKSSIKGSHPIVVDATLGLGGHTEALLNAHPELTVIGFDRDPVALELASERLSKFGSRFRGVLATYDQIQSVLEELGIDSVQGILFDLGVSSMQLDSAERGFAYAQDAPLDMRMDQTAGISAADLLASESEEELAQIFRVFGEERFANPIARAIVRERLLKPIESSAQLNRIVESVVPKAPGKQSGHPAKRVYQALRIAVNNELAILTKAMPQAIDALAVGGRIVVMSYHSLEDAIVKQAFQSAAISSTPIELPIELPGSGPRLRVITKGVERANEIELSQNPRAASARLRAAEKLEAA
jgi:16S rRNA (cytosine1402-N4)-methyltransferase